MKRQPMKLRKFTVFGVCQEQRHGYLMEAKDAAEAEMKAVRNHDREAGCLLVVAAVVEGQVAAVEKTSSGIDEQMRRVNS